MKDSTLILLPVISVLVVSILDPDFTPKDYHLNRIKTLLPPPVALKVIDSPTQIVIVAGAVIAVPCACRPVIGGTP